MERIFEERQSPSPSFQMDITGGGENPNELMIDAENRSADQSLDPSVPSVPISFSDLSFPCSEAEKSIALDISLMEHLIVYKGRRYHSCPECGKRFLREQTLREHQHVHSGEKPFICSDCGKCFSKNMQLADHQRRMHTKRYHRLLKKLSNQKRLAYTIPFKLEVVNYAKEHGNRAAERHFGPPPTEKMIREWRKQEEQLQKADLNKHTFRKHPARWPQLDTDMQEWLARHRDNGFSVSAKMIMYEAKRIAGEKGVQDFTGSPSWCYRFMQRCGLALRNKTRIKQKMPKEYESKILSFHKMVIDARKQDDFQMSQIGNMDEVPLTFDVPFNRSVDVEGGENLAVKTSVHEKFRCTVVLSCCADGTKLPPMLIFKRKSAPTEEVPEGVVVHVHSKGWMDENGMTVWVEEVWSKRPGGLLKRPSLLVLDEFRAHVCETAKRSFRESKTRLAVIPWGLTSQLQPLDVSVNKPFKGLMAEEWNKWVAAVQHDPTPTGRMKRPSIAQVCEWVKTAWQTVTGEAVARSFKKCGISNALDGTEDALVYEDSEESDASDCEPMGFLNSDTSDDEFEKST